MGQKSRKIGKLEVQLLWGNIVFPIGGSEGVVDYDLFVAYNCVIPSYGKGTIETRLAVSLSRGICS